MLLLVFQVVVMEGINTTGRQLVATKLYEVPQVPLPPSRPVPGTDVQFVLLRAYLLASQFSL